MSRPKHLCILAKVVPAACMRKYSVTRRSLPAEGWGSNVLCSDFVDEYQVCLGAVLLMGVDVAFDDSHVVFVLQGSPSAIVL